jgi:hypothetical protein
MKKVSRKERNEHKTGNEENLTTDEHGAAKPQPKLNGLNRLNKLNWVKERSAAARS